MVFDLVDKIREIGATGDLAAQQTIAMFDKARREHDVRASLSFEKDLLSLARDKFEFISPIEFIDLSRLADDRNRCAHPSQVSDTEVFEAMPELARLHIVNAVKYVLSKPAAQGKVALDRVLADLDSRFFPSKFEDVKVFLNAGPLAKPRESLLKNYLSVIVKDLIKIGDISLERIQRAEFALFVLRDMHPEPWNRLIPEILTTIIPTLQDDKQLIKATLYLGKSTGSQLWAHVSEANRLRLSTFVENYPSEELSDLEYLISTSHPLHTAATKRIKQASADDLFNNGLWFEAPTVVIDRLLELYGVTSNFADANNFAKRLRHTLLDSKEPEKHFDTLVRIAKSNKQVRDSIQFPILVKEFVDKMNLNKDYAKNSLEAAGLEPIEW
ncbi:hypothetical protein QZM92_27800 [Burkholderia multivorans]|uniref:hypothetical protein n=1 Tax=Burkholderia multivorans TaxID=87883 RepID=UPI001C25F22B|nr:hypothetical protein [Burkholderia multivorans]MBU9576750.1 hypothetical protein [Burkholderia multivorans]MDN7965775.1 hypothetical protein [Burkholderia multivorans]